jgi:hydroxymethylpyrimidine/phosphomethylpyrimidine kinase
MAEPAITGGVLTVAGYDPSSGAGITADLEVFHNHGVLGVSAVSALTVQGRSGVRRVEPVDAGLLRETLELLADEVQLAGVKIGMLATAELARTVTKFLSRAQIPRERVVLDPVIRSSSGAELSEPKGVWVVREEMLPLVGWITPNVGEANLLLGEDGSGRQEVPDLARKLQETAAREQGTGSELNVVVTGGDLDPPDDFLLTAEGEEVWIRGRRVEARSVHGAHGTGCVFSSALLCRLLLGDGKVDAVRGAKAAVVRRLEGQPVARSR